MSKPSLADEFARQLAEDADDNDFGCWATDNRDRILAALRVAEIVREPTDEQAIAFVYGMNGLDPKNFSAPAGPGDIHIHRGRACLAVVLALANEAGERDE